jgi:hypothetical protein
MSVEHMTCIYIAHHLIIDLEINERSVLGLRKCEVIEDELFSGDYIVQSKVRNYFNIVSACE